MMEVDAAQKLNGLGKEVDKEEGKELEWKDTTYFNPVDFWWVGMMPLLGTPGIPYFSGVNILDFYTWYEAMAADYSLNTRDTLSRLPRYCELTIGNHIRMIEE